MKKIGVFVLMLIILMAPIQTLAASNMSGEYTPPMDSDYWQKKISWKLYFDFQTYKVVVRQYEPDVAMSEETIVTTKTYNVKQNSFMWIDMKCKGPTSFEFLDENGDHLSWGNLRGDTDTYLNEGTCDGNSISPSDYNEEENKYASDTFGATEEPLTNPPTADGSGGTGETGYLGEDDGTGEEPGGEDPGGEDPGGGDGTDPGGDGGDDGSGSGECDSCSVLDCPKWDEHMEQLEDIKNKIPAPPNWPEVADEFRDSIVPKVISDLDDLLGSAPTPPAPPQIPEGVDDRGFENAEPQGEEAPGLGDTDFSKIKDEAPVIEEKPDNSEGFNILNPIEALPSQDEFLENIPDAVDNPAPDPPMDNNETAPMPDDSNGNAPIPDDGGGTAPLPNDNTDNAPVPGDSEGLAPIPGNDGGTAPIPGDTNETAPLPNESGTAPLPGQP